MECIYCKKEFKPSNGNQVFCSVNHQKYYNAARLRKENAATIKELKSKFPFLFDKDYVCNENDIEYIKWCFENKELVEKLIWSNDI